MANFTFNNELKKMSRAIIALCFLFSIFSISQAQAKDARLPQESRVPGGIALIPVGNTPTPPKVSFNGNQVMVLPDYQSDNLWLAVVGIPITQKVGKAKIIANGKPLSFNVKAKEYPKQYLTVKNKHVNPNKAQLERIWGEQKKSKKAFKQFSYKKGWEKFIWPVNGPLTSLFGFQRFFNNQPRRPHSGLDIAAPKNTPIKSPASGEVILTGHMFFNGKAVFIDHGQGLISMMCHLNSIDVKQGQLLKQGDIIGKVGTTGRSTGPHLHWSVSFNNARIDPLLMVDKAENKQ